MVCVSAVLLFVDTSSGRVRVMSSALLPSSGVSRTIGSGSSCYFTKTIPLSIKLKTRTNRIIALLRVATTTPTLHVTSNCGRGRFHVRGPRQDPPPSQTTCRLYGFNPANDWRGGSRLFPRPSRRQQQRQEQRTKRGTRWTSSKGTTSSKLSHNSGGDLTRRRLPRALLSQDATAATPESESPAEVKE